MSNGTLTKMSAIPLGIGSIIGSGILFLPSLTYKTSESDVLISWLTIIFFCLLGVSYLKRLLFISPVHERNIAGMVRAGLGNNAGDSVYLLLLGTVLIGMPSAAIIAGDYMELAFNIPFLKEATAIFLITFAIGANLKGVKGSSKVASILAIALVLVAILFIFLTSSYVTEIKTPNFDLPRTYKGAVLAFWAFAGFENLTFLYNRFKNPKKDFVPTIVISIISCGLLYLFLVINYASIVEYDEIETTVGLLQITNVLNIPALKPTIALFAFFAVLINLVSWTSGIAELLKLLSEKKIIPFLPENMSNKSSVKVLGALFTMSLSISLILPQFFEVLLGVVSTNFLIIYSMTFLSYIVIEKTFSKKLIPIFAFLSLLLIISSSGAKLLYPLLLILAVIITNTKKGIKEC